MSVVLTDGIASGAGTVAGSGLGGTALLRVRDMRRNVAKRFAENAIEVPDLDARLLVGHVLGLDHGGLINAAERTLTCREIEAIEALVARRLSGEPVARIIGTKEFWGLPLALTPAVLVPRPETETVVEQALAAGLRNGPRERQLLIADLGVGSGAIMLALLSELPNAFAVGTDRDPAALRASRHSAHLLGLADRAYFIVCDFGAALAGGFDIVVANPPYVRSADIATLPSEVRDFDPHLALDGGADGLDAYRAIARDARRLLSPSGNVVVEVGAGQAAAVSSLFAAAGLGRIEIASDLAGIPRVVAASA